MRNPDNAPLDDLLFDCCQEMFASYELVVEPRPREEFPPRERLSFCSVMGFGGKQMRGALVLASTKEPLEQTNVGDAESQRDLVCELSNQLMGRIKNRLLSWGAEVHLATPAGLSGNNLSLWPAKLRAPQVFKAADGHICVWIDFEYLDGFELPTTPSATMEAAIPEGEALLF
jgi:hypothetical protein